jgi:hypothetical protein
MRKVKARCLPPEDSDGIIDDEEVARQVKNGELVPMDSVPLVPREEMLQEIRKRVKDWRKPPLKQDRPPT